MNSSRNNKNNQCSKKVHLTIEVEYKRLVGSAHGQIEEAGSRLTDAQAGMRGCLVAKHASFPINKLRVARA